MGTLLSTGVISGQGYETINFIKNSHKNIINGEVRLAIKDQYVHQKGEIKFIDISTSSRRFSA